MRGKLFIAVLSVVVPALACVHAGPGGDGPAATVLSFAPKGLEGPRVIAAMSMPPQFEIVFERAMPTPGWRIVVDSVEVDGERARIVAKLSEIAPEGMVAQVITKTQGRIPLGELQAGSYVLEVWMRRGTTTPHALTQAFVLTAR